MLNDKSMINEATKYAEAKGKKLIEISNWYNNKFNYKHTVKTDLGIEEFLGYFKYADTIICNAFHGLCFSVIFKKEVFLFLRDESDFRMQSITDQLALSSRLIGWKDRHIPFDLPQIDYPNVYSFLNKYRKKSNDFIKENILN